MLVYNGKKFIIFYACYTKYKKKRVRCLSNSFFNVFLNIYIYCYIFGNDILAVTMFMIFQKYHKPLYIEVEYSHKYKQPLRHL